MTELNLNDIEILCSKSKNIEINNDIKYEKNVANKDMLIKILNKTNFCTDDEYQKLNTLDKQKPTIFYSKNLLDSLKDMFGDNILNSDKDILKDVLLISINKDKEYKNLITKYNNNVDLKDNRELYKNVINILFDSLIYISFNEFYERLETLANLFISNANLNNYNQIIFYVSDKINKSNTWIFVLFMKKIILCKDYKIFKDKYNNKCIFTNNLNNDNLLDDSILLHFDDMTYSGTQVISDIEININKINKKIKYYLVIPYYTNSAIYNFENNFYSVGYDNKNDNDKDIYFFDDNGVILTISETIDNNEIFKKIKNDNMKNEIKFMLGINEDNNENYHIQSIIYKSAMSSYSLYNKFNSKPTIFFQHKLADYYSTFLQLYYVGPVIGYYDSTYKGKCLSYPLIKPCIFDKYYEKQKQQDYCKYNYIETLDNEYGCPKTYYKQNILSYIYDTKELDKSKYLFEELLKYKKIKKLKSLRNKSKHNTYKPQRNTINRTVKKFKNKSNKTEYTNSRHTNSRYTKTKNKFSKKKYKIIFKNIKFII